MSRLCLQRCCPIGPTLVTVIIGEHGHCPATARQMALHIDHRNGVIEPGESGFLYCLGTTNVLPLLLLLLPVLELQFFNLSNFSQCTQFLQLHLIFAISSNFYNYTKFSKFHLIFKIIPNFQIYALLLNYGQI
jgi:hypothetical protein